MPLFYSHKSPVKIYAARGLNMLLFFLFGDYAYIFVAHHIGKPAQQYRGENHDDVEHEMIRKKLCDSVIHSLKSQGKNKLCHGVEGVGKIADVRHAFGYAGKNDGEHNCRNCRQKSRDKTFCHRVLMCVLGFNDFTCASVPHDVVNKEKIEENRYAGYNRAKRRVHTYRGHCEHYSEDGHYELIEDKT